MPTQVVWVKLTSAGADVGSLSIKDCFGVTLLNNLSRNDMLIGLTLSVDTQCATVSVVSNTLNCINKVDVPIANITTSTTTTTTTLGSTTTTTTTTTTTSTTTTTTTFGGTLYAIQFYSGGTTTTCTGASLITKYTTNPAWSGFTNGEVIYNLNGTVYNGSSGLFSENTYCTYGNINSVGVVSGRGNCTNCV